MNTPKRTYQPPVTSVTRLVVESAICAGSVQFGDADKQIYIENQGVATVENNDFSQNEWTFDNTQSTTN